MDKVQQSLFFFFRIANMKMSGLKDFLPNFCWCFQDWELYGILSWGPSESHESENHGVMLRKCCGEEMLKNTFFFG